VVLSELSINTPDVSGAVRVEEGYGGLPVAIRGFGVYVNTTAEAAADRTAGMGVPFTEAASGQLAYVLHPLSATVQTQLLCSLWAGRTRPRVCASTSPWRPSKCV
jgi:hypothetical protein